MRGLTYTAIEYCLNPDGTAGYHWPIWTGCAQPPSVCATKATCWARSLHKRFGKQWAELYKPDFSPRFNEAILEAPYSLRKPSRILVAFMGDLFGDWMAGSLGLWPGETIISMIKQVVWDLPHHQFLFLTKSPKNLAQFDPWPDNAWVGASATNANTLNLACYCLYDVKAKIKWISLEPLLDWHPLFPSIQFPPHISWVVIGAQSGPGAVKPKLDNVLDIIRAADEAKVPIWIKRNLRKVYPELPIREELPFTA